jgi:hypothetical protein
MPGNQIDNGPDLTSLPLIALIVLLVLLAMTGVDPRLAAVFP